MYDVMRLKTAMLEQALTVSALARKAKMPQSTVQKIFERGSGHPKNVQRLAKTLRVELKDIVVVHQEKSA